ESRPHVVQHVFLRAAVDEQRYVVGDGRVADEAIEVEAAEIRDGAGIDVTAELFRECVEPTFGLSFELATRHGAAPFVSRDAHDRSGSAQSGGLRKSGAWNYRSLGCSPQQKRRLLRAPRSLGALLTRG